MMGDVATGDLVAAVDRVPPGTPASGGRLHVLLDEKSRVEFFKSSATGDPRSRFPSVRWIQLAGSSLWVSYGELNALADYLPNATSADTLPAAQLIPVLQRMRQGIADQCRDVMGLANTSFAGAAWSTASALSSAGGEVRALDQATAGLGQNRYAGLLARNACHFAPMSWERWALNHNEARAHAITHHASGTASSSGGVTASASNDERQAWIINGYGDHFLQDSFAAGHLVNKTLVMQWFAQWLITQFPWVLRPTVGVPGATVGNGMADPTQSGHGQAGIAGRGLYSGPHLHTTASADQSSGTGITDTQSAQERTSAAGRVGGSGVVAEGGRSQSQRFSDYGEFLNSAYYQNAAGAAHNWFNARGLSVTNSNGDVIRVGGDDTFLTESDRAGVRMASTAAQMSQRAIQELLATGATSITQEQIFALVPKRVNTGGTSVGLEAWNDTILHDLCIRTIFPEIIADPTNDALRAPGLSEMVSGGVIR